mmetsp:Transcript_36600/g.87336  ORF Transcript_36600/g.87336 Transcript_36600/m.87336 type:complete len:283 (-) Transcript_36600:974-1822(-)
MSSGTGASSPPATTASPSRSTRLDTVISPQWTSLLAARLSSGSPCRSPRIPSPSLSWQSSAASLQVDAPSGKSTATARTGSPSLFLRSLDRTAIEAVDASETSAPLPTPSPGRSLDRLASLSELPTTAVYPAPSTWTSAVLSRGHSRTSPESSVSVAPARAAQFLPPLMGDPSDAFRSLSHATREGRAGCSMLAFGTGAVAVPLSFFFFLPWTLSSDPPSSSSSSPSSYSLAAMASCAASANASSRFSPPSPISSARSAGVSAARTSASLYETYVKSSDEAS